MKQYLAIDIGASSGRHIVGRLEDGRILWKNDAFAALMTQGPRKEKYLNKMIPDLHPGVFPKGDLDHSLMEVTYKDRDYQVELRRVSLQGFSEKEELLQIPEDEEFFVAVSLQDVTELNAYIRENEDQRMIAGLVYIDNYDEVMESVEEVRQSLLVALIDRKINKYIGDVDGIVKKMEKDKYFIVLKKESYRKIAEDKFSLLEEVKQVNIGNARSATLSIGLGLNTATYALSYQYARVAIDLALARGGDQAVIKDCNGITYFGGKKEQNAKNTRVKARVKAEALREFIVTKDQVMVMGHKIGDPDSFGACMGIYRAAVTLEKIISRYPQLEPQRRFIMSDPVFPDEKAFIAYAEKAIDYLGVKYHESIEPRKRVSERTYNNVAASIRKMQIRLYNERDNLRYYGQDAQDSFSYLEDLVIWAAEDLAGKEVVMEKPTVSRVSGIDGI